MFDANFTITEELTNVWVEASVSTQTSPKEEFIELAKTNADFCHLERTMWGLLFLKFFGSLFQEVSNLNLACPVLKNDYHVSKLKIPNLDDIPPILPKFDCFWQILGTFKGKIKNSKPFMLVRLRLTGSTYWKQWVATFVFDLFWSCMNTYFCLIHFWFTLNWTFNGFEDDQLMIFFVILTLASSDFGKFQHLPLSVIASW